MEVVIKIILVLSVVALLFSFFMLWRNRQVSKYRKGLISLIHEQTQKDIATYDFEKDIDPDPTRLWGWRYDVFSSVSYDTMVNKFWKPLDSFYPDKSFIEEGRGESKCLH